ncbi:hypothetical protein BDV93DRAFT_189067 [Ceratobasidium sp. AG-I]|nr:hypothetical protein BDV93DRAFT_189067 [Ceratobasidium sp. AG-I]
MECCGTDAAVIVSTVHASDVRIRAASRRASCGVPWALLLDQIYVWYCQDMRGTVRHVSTHRARLTPVCDLTLCRAGSDGLRASECLSAVSVIDLLVLALKLSGLRVMTSSRLTRVE